MRDVCINTDAADILRPHTPNIDTPMESVRYSVSATMIRIVAHRTCTIHFFWYSKVKYSVHLSVFLICTMKYTQNMML
jgi:hypothetical protein